MKKAIITGATSFIGIHLIHKLIREKWKIYAVIRKNSLKSAILPFNDQLKVIELEMGEYERLPAMISEPCDVFVSLAWNGTRGLERADAKRQEENFKYSMEALKAVNRIGCKMVIGAGSQAEYGPITDKISESDACNPNTEYGEWKLKYYEAAMKFCRENKISFKEPRFFSLYGEDDSDKTMILSVLDNMINNRVCKLTQCVQMWDFLYIDDAVEGVFRLMEKECSDGAYNVGSGDTRPLKDFIMEMYKLTDSVSELQFGSILYPETGMVSVYPDISKLREQTGWRAKTTFEEGIRKIIDYKRTKMRK